MSVFKLHPFSNQTRFIYDAVFPSREAAIDNILEASKLDSEFKELRQAWSSGVMESVRFMAEELYCGVEEYGGFNSGGLVRASVVPYDKTRWLASVLVSSELPEQPPSTIHGQITEYWGDLTNGREGPFDQILVVSEHGVGITVTGNIAREYHDIHGRDVTVFIGPWAPSEWGQVYPHDNKRMAKEWERRRQWIPHYSKLVTIPNITTLSRPDICEMFWGANVVIIDLHSIPSVFWFME